MQFRSIYRAHTEGSICRSTSILYAGYHVQVSFINGDSIFFFFFFALYLGDGLSRACFYSCFFFFFFFLVESNLFGKFVIENILYGVFNYYYLLFFFLS